METTTSPVISRHGIDGQAARRRWHELTSSKKFGHRVWLFTTWIILALGAIVMLFPIWWQVSASLKSDLEIYQWPVHLIPNPIRWDNYEKLFSGLSRSSSSVPSLPFALFLRNSVIVTGFSVVGTVISSAVVAFAFARLRAPGKNVLFALVLAKMMLPSQVTMIPIFIMFAKINWINTFYPLIVPWFLGAPFFIFLLRQFFMSLPPELSDAVKIDGGSYWTEFTQIVLPLSLPALATVSVMSFISHWNDFFNALVYLSQTNKYTLAVGLALQRGGVETREVLGLVMAGCVIMVIPIVVLFLVFQKTLVQGVALTGITGR